MKRYFFVILFCICFFNKNANSQNLVLNPSFELLKDTCYPYLSGIQDSACLNWDSPTNNSPDYFNVCSNTLLQGFGMGVPINFGGGGTNFQYAQDGNAYAGYFHNVGASREYIQGTIQDSLTIGKKYRCYYYLALQSFFAPTDASNNFGIGFTTYHVKQDSTWMNITNFLPKINDTTVISDTLNWVKVEGTFIADSAYKFFTIGNFFDFNHSKGLSSYYYLDDVHIEEVKGDGVEEVGKEKLEVYPNPVTNQLTVSSNQFKVNTIEVTNLLGQLQNVKVEKLTTENCQLNTENLPSGIYFIKAKDTKGTVSVGKFVKE